MFTETKDETLGTNFIMTKVEKQDVSVLCILCKERINSGSAIRWLKFSMGTLCVNLNLEREERWYNHEAVKVLESHNGKLL